MNYKSYQQVLDFSGIKEHKVVKMRRKSTKPAIERAKRRTRSGCLTCRRRKKKCDENKTGGKCNACIRNFLECCWPGTNNEVTNRNQEVITTTLGLNTPVASPSAHNCEGPRSPLSHDEDDEHDISTYSTDEDEYKLMNAKDLMQSSETQVPKSEDSREHTFIITSVAQDRELCQIR